MKKLLIQIITFFKKDHMIKYAVITLGFVLMFSLLLHMAAADVVDNVFGTIVGFTISSILLYVCKIVVGRLEDMLKINYDTDSLMEIYHGRPDYKKCVESQGTKAEFVYADVLINKNYEFKVVDDPKKVMQLDDFITENYATIFSAHSNSAKKNYDTIRLDRFDAETNTFYLSRSTYFNHLVTNRAVDFLIFEEISLRSIYEYGPQLNKLEDSKMSNHIGINALVFLSDGRLLIPKRKNSSTISKNKVTSSIAVMLNFPNESKTDTKSAVITAEYLLRDNIFKNLSDRVRLPASAIDAAETEIQFLGFGQNIYEGGKPQFYFAVKLNNIDTATYFAKKGEYEEEQRRLHKKEILDVDKCMYAADYDSFLYQKGGVRFNAYDDRGKHLRLKANYEMSYLCNLWHYEKSKEN